MKHIVIVTMLMIVGAVCLGLQPGAVVAQDAALPLAEVGTYDQVGRQEFSFVDESRDRTLTGYIWYPAGQTQGTRRPGPLLPQNNAAPYADAAPYPLVFFSHPRTVDGVDAKSTMDIAQYLASYGFIVVSIEHHDPSPHWPNLIHRPMDILFTLNHLASISGEDALAGLMNFDRVGVMGYSFGATASLELTGAQIDPLGREAYCTTSTQTRSCQMSDEAWQATLDERAQYDPPVTADELWPAYTDERIAAVMPIAPCLGPLFGENGLANATVPTLLVGLEKDEVCPYTEEALYIYERLGSPDKALLEVLGLKHTDGFGDRTARSVYRQFAVAFFGYHLQGQEEYAEYLTVDFVAGFDNLEWTSPAE
ncbi:MAG: hypothetical protein K8I60_00160 [Anaerolineae bacterium]|nr:hypothetical protein [Anaerolineae bacterium]